MNIFFWRKKKQNAFLIYGLIFLLVLMAAVYFLYRNNAGLAGKYVPVADKGENQTGDSAAPVDNNSKESEGENMATKEEVSENKGDLDQRLRAVMNLCPPQDQQMISGVFESLDSEYVYVKQPPTQTREETIEKIKLLPETVYARAENGPGDKITQTGAVFGDLAAGQSALVIAAADSETGELSALIVKRIDFKE